LPLLEIRHERGETTLRFPDRTELDEGLADTLGAELTAAACDAGGRHVVLDLAPIEFLTSAILGALLSFHRAVAAAGGRLTVANTRPAVRELFAITCLDRILNLGPA
jgi:anti-sigma B factor antagonist